MTDSKRLLEASENRFLRSLLDSAAIDEPPEAAVKRLLAGAGAASAASLLAGEAAGSASPAFAASTGTVSTKAVAWTLIAKWVGVGAISGIATAEVAHYALSRRAQDDRSAISTAAPSPGPSNEVRSFGEVAGPAFSTGALTPETRAPVLTPRSAGPPTRSADASPEPRGSGAPEAPTKLLADEVTLLEQARRAIVGGNAALALRLLDDYAARKKTGVLDREAAVLRIDAMLAKGEPDRAADLARRYLAEHPGDAHARRLRELAAQAGIQDLRDGH